MTFEEFEASLKNDLPPQRISIPLKAMWYDAQNNWKQAHLVVQEADEYSGAWVHGYLHRKEGDLANAAYWYSRAGKEMPKKSLEAEWVAITKELIDSEKK